MKKNIQQSNLRSEEIQHIIEKMPTKFGYMISLIVLSIFLFMMIFGWIIRYPDVISGQITINSANSPIKLVANAPGKLHLLSTKSMEAVSEGQIIAYVENGANPFTIERIDSILKTQDPTSESIYKIADVLPKNASIGDLNIKYYTLLNSLQQLKNYTSGKLFQKQDKNLNEILDEQMKAIDVANNRVDMIKKSVNFTHKFYSRDSLLFKKRVISEGEFDKSEMNYFAAKDSYQSAISNLINMKQQARSTEGKLQELNVASPEKKKDLKIAIISAYNEFVDSKKIWDQKYVFRAPFDGKVQFMKFYSENQFIQSTEPVFVVIPSQKQVYGQLILPSQGSGKIKKGQEVIVKLDNYPYIEYGSIRGIVSSISITTITTKTDSEDKDNYLIAVDFPEQLKTNYGEVLDYKVESKGVAEIITKDRRLIERLFDNLKYALKK